MTRLMAGTCLSTIVAFPVLCVSTRSPVLGGLVANASRMSLENARFSVDAYFRYCTQQHHRGAGLSMRRLHSTAWRYVSSAVDVTGDAISMESRAVIIITVFLKMFFPEHSLTTHDVR